MKQRVYTQPNKLAKQRKPRTVKPKKNSEPEPEKNPNGTDVPGLYKQANGTIIEIKHIKDSDGFIRQITFNILINNYNANNTDKAD